MQKKRKEKNEDVVNPENKEASEAASETNAPKKSDNISKIEKKKLDRSVVFLLLGEILILAICLITAVSVKSGSKPFDISLKEWRSDYITYEKEGWSANPETVRTGEEVDLIYGPYLKVNRGAYLITVEYSATEDQNCYAASSGGQENFLKAGNSKLYKNMNTVSFRAETTHEIDNFEVIVRYNGNGELTVKNITIQEDYSMFARLFVYILLLFAVCDLWYLFADKVSRNRNLILFLLGIALLCSIPLLTEGIGKGHDLNYHAMRIDALADSLKHGIFPNRISSLWFNGYGYPSSIYYGDLLLYIPAVLRIAGFSVVTSYKVYVLFINLATVIISYLSFKGIFGGRNTALISTLVYSTATYRLVNIYVRSAVGEYTAMMFFPVVAYAVYKIYTDSENIRKNALFLALGMTGLITCHILSTEMVVFLIVIICLVLFKKTFKPSVIKTYLLAMGETLLLGAYFIIPFADYYRNVTVDINDMVENAPFIQYQGCTPAEYFAVFRDIFSGYSVHYNERLASTPGFILMMTLFVGIAVFVNRKDRTKGKDILFYAVFSILSLFLASNVFPWDAFAQDSLLGRLLAQVQFPWRYVAIAIVFLSLLFSALIKMLLEKDFGDRSKLIRNSTLIVVTAVCLASTFLFTGNFLDDIRYRTWYDTADLETGSVGSGEYKLLDAADELDNKVHSVAMNMVETIEKDGCKMVLYCEGTGREGTVEVPRFNYKGYVVEDEAGNRYDIEEGEGGTVKFTLPKNFKGQITVDFVSPWYWKFGEIVTLLSVIYLCTRGIISKKLKNKSNSKE